MGIDLSNVHDLAALALIAPVIKDGAIKRVYIHVENFLPRRAVEFSPNKNLYKSWARVKNAYLFLTEGDTTDYNMVAERLRFWNKKRVANS